MEIPSNTSWRMSLCGLCLFLTIALSVCAAELSKKTIKLKNECAFHVWPGIASWNTHQYDIPAGFPPLLKSGESQSLAFDMSWEGSIWGRLGCAFNRSEQGHCYSGDCGGKLRCERALAQEKILTPVTQAVFMNGSCAVDLQAGYNLPMSVVPSSLKNCGYHGCSAYVGAVCPTSLQVKHEAKAIGCEGECNAYLGTCSPPAFSSAFQKACPHVFPFQERVWCFSSAYYTLTFCPKKET